MFDKVSWTSQNKSSVHTHINNFVNAKLDIAQESLFSKRKNNAGRVLPQQGCSARYVAKQMNVLLLRLGLLRFLF